MIVRHWWLRCPALALIGLLVLVGARSQAADEAAETRMRKDITFLASDECEGRGPATKGIDLAANYIAAEFKKAGLKPAGADGSYFQLFTIPGATLAKPNRFRLRGPQGQELELKLGEHFQVLGLSRSGKVNAPVVFAGYGATTAKDVGYDDYQDLDVAGKVVVVLRDTPRADNKFSSFDGARRRRHASFTEKLLNAEKHKAAAVIFVNDRDTARSDDELVNFSYMAATGSPAKLPAVQLRRAVLEEMLEASFATSLEEREQDIDRELKPHSTPLAGWTASLEVSVSRGALPLKNVVGVLDGSGELAQETVVVGAHYDHLGYGGAYSLAGLKRMAIHHGADDNGSGTTTIMELARRFGHLPNRPDRRLVFIAFSGEEEGLLGSAYYCKHPIFPLADTAAMVNLDMVGRLHQDAASKKDELLLEGTGSGKNFNRLLDTLNTNYHFKLNKKAGGILPLSDHFSFYAKQVPVIFLWTGYHPDYHRPSDTADKINVHGMARIADLCQDVIANLTTTPERPQYVKLRVTGGFGGTQVPRIGVRPSYTDDGEGVLLDGVNAGEPAAKAGLKEGDRIVEIASKPVKNLESYMSLMAGHKKGEKLDFGIVRGGKKMTIQVTLE